MSKENIRTAILEHTKQHPEDIAYWLADLFENTRNGSSIKYVFRTMEEIEETIGIDVEAELNDELDDE
jgi:hypothetical protein